MALQQGPALSGREPLRQIPQDGPACGGVSSRQETSVQPRKSLGFPPLQPGQPGLTEAVERWGAPGPQAPGILQVPGQVVQGLAHRRLTRPAPPQVVSPGQGGLGVEGLLQQRQPEQRRYWLIKKRLQPGREQRQHGALPPTPVHRHQQGQQVRVIAMVAADPLQTGLGRVKPLEAEVAKGQGQPKAGRRRLGQLRETGQQLGFGLDGTPEAAEPTGAGQRIVAGAAGGRHRGGRQAGTDTLPRRPRKNPLSKEGVERKRDGATSEEAAITLTGQIRT